MTLDDNRLRITEAFKSGKIQVISGFPGLGKTWLVRLGLLPNLVDSHYTYFKYLDKEKMRQNPEFPRNYLKYVQESIAKGKIVAAPIRLETRILFELLHIPFLMLYPTRSEKETYIRRYETRGSDDRWIECKRLDWDDKLNVFEKEIVPDNCYKDELPAGYTLTRYLAELGIIDYNPEDMVSVKMSGKLPYIITETVKQES